FNVTGCIELAVQTAKLPGRDLDAARVGAAHQAILKAGGATENASEVAPIEDEGFAKLVRLGTGDGAAAEQHVLAHRKLRVGDIAALEAQVDVRLDIGDVELPRSDGDELPVEIGPLPAQRHARIGRLHAARTAAIPRHDARLTERAVVAGVFPPIVVVAVVQRPVESDGRAADG